MLYVSNSLSFKDQFMNSHPFVIDLSKIPTSQLVEECDSILDHHRDVAVYFGYLEPGYMLDQLHQTRLRRIIRKFPVGFMCKHIESIPFSWKNEIDTIVWK